MKTIKFGVLAAVILYLLSIVPTGRAGGWVVMTLTELPKQFVMGETYDIEFSIRRHGQLLEPGNSPAVIALNSETNETLRVAAKALSPPGFYTASVVFPSAGVWTWALELYEGYDQTMPVIEVIAPERIQDKNWAPKIATSGGFVLSMLGAFTFISGAVGLVLKRSRPFVFIAAIGVFILLMGFTIPSTRAIVKNEVSENSTHETSEVDYGRDLFLAKGCIVCHSHPEVLGKFRGVHVGAGPDVSKLDFTEEYLRIWLADPAAVKRDTEMPDLRLSDVEISALVAFLTKK